MPLYNIFCSFFFTVWKRTSVPDVNDEEELSTEFHTLLESTIRDVPSSCREGYSVIGAMQWSCKTSWRKTRPGEPAADPTVLHRTAVETLCKGLS